MRTAVVDRLADLLRAPSSSALLVAPTGSGKTVIAVALISQLGAAAPGSTCLMVHRRELMDQAVGHFRTTYPDWSVSEYCATRKSWDGQVVIASVNSLCTDRGLESIPTSAVNLVVIDETHHVRAPTWELVLNTFRDRNPAVRILGITATPNRRDRLGLGTLFTHYHEVMAGDLVDDGFLVPVVAHTRAIAEFGAQEASASASAVDQKFFAASALLKPVALEAMFSQGKELGGDRQTVIFCVMVVHAKHVAEFFQAKGVPTVFVDSLSMSRKERAERLSEYASGHAQVVVNCAVLAEGWDDPPTSCVVIARRFCTMSSMIQMVGRGRRTLDPVKYPGQPANNDCVVIDFGDSVKTHRSWFQTIDLVGAALQTISHGDVEAESLSEEAATEEEDDTPFHMVEIEVSEKRTVRDAARGESVWRWVRVHQHQYAATSSLQPHVIAIVEKVGRKKHAWTATGWSNNELARIANGVEQGDCARLADAWLNNNMYSKRKMARSWDIKTWMDDPASEKQKTVLETIFKIPATNIDKYQAGVIITLKKLENSSRGLCAASESLHASRDEYSRRE